MFENTEMSSLGGNGCVHTAVLKVLNSKILVALNLRNFNP
jgi:hypothetical protein